MSYMLSMCLLLCLSNYDWKAKLLISLCLSIPTYTTYLTTFPINENNPNNSMIPVRNQQSTLYRLQTSVVPLQYGDICFVPSYPALQDVDVWYSATQHRRQRIS